MTVGIRGEPASSVCNIAARDTAMHCVRHMGATRPREKEYSPSLSVMATIAVPFCAGTSAIISTSLAVADEIATTSRGTTG